MADEVEEMEDDGTSAEATADTIDSQSLRVSRLELSSAKTSEPRSPIEPDVTFDEAPEVGAKKEDQIVFDVSNGGDEKWPNIEKKKPVTPNLPRQPRSACRARSRDTRQCQKQFREMIGKHETRNDELEQREGDLRQRLEMLECSMPAVMTWNMWRMAQNGPASNVRRLLEKQFQDHGGGGADVPSTPSKHYDCRVREIEAERKEALRRAEEARVLLAEKEAAVQERRKLLDDARKCNEERREKMEKLSREAAELRSALKNARGDDNSCETGECGEIRCRDKWLDNVGSVSSIGSTDLECFAKLQELAESEICMKRQISELERREEAYMRTLQQADELWSKMEGDTADTVSELQVQLGSKTAANQQLADRICSLEDELEKSRIKLVGCKDALSKFTDRKFSDVEIGFDDGEATVTDRGIVAAVKTAAASTVAAAPTRADQETVAFPEAADKESSFVTETVDAGTTASAKMSDKDAEAIIDQKDRGVDRPTGLGIDAGVGDEEARVERPDGLRSKTGTPRRLKRRGSEPIDLEDDEDDEDIPEHWKDWNWDEGCPPDAICDDMIESSTGTDDLQRPKGVSTTESEGQATPEVVDQPVGERRAEDLAEIEQEVVLRSTDAPQQATGMPTTGAATKVTKETDGNVLETDQIILSREELRNWYNIVDSVHHTIGQCVNCSSKINDTAQLAERMKLHLRIKGLSVVKEPAVVKESARPVASTDPAEIGDEIDSSVLGEVRTVDEEPPLPAETVEITVVSETKPLTDGQLDALDKLSKESERQKGTSEEESAGEIMTAASQQELSQVEPKEVAETDSSVLGEVQKIDEEPPLPAETVEITVVSETKPHTDGQLDTLDKFSEKSEQQNGTSEEESAGEIMPATSQQELSQVEPKEVAVTDPSVLGEVQKIDEEPPLPAETVAITVVSETKPDTDEQLDILDKFSEKSKQQKGTSEDESAGELMLAASQQELSQVKPKEVAEPIVEDRSFPESESAAPAVPEEIVVKTEIRAGVTDIPGDRTSTAPTELSEALAKALSAPEEFETEPGDSKEPSAQPLKVPDDDAETKQPVAVLETTVVDETSSEVDTKEAARVEETTISFVTPRTPPPSKMNVQSHQGTAEDIPAEIERASESVAESLIKSEELELVKEDPQQETPVQPTIRTKGIPQSEIERETPKIQSPPDEDSVELLADKVPDKICGEGPIAKVPEPSVVRKPYLPVAKVESVEKLKLPKSLDRCICKPRTCPLLRRAASPQSKLKAPKLFTEGTQTSSQISKGLLGRLDRLNLKTITESTWPSPEVGIWRRPMVCPRDPRDKSTLTTACVDIQTDGALVRERKALGGIERKDRGTTFSGVCPKYTEHGGCPERVSPQPQAPVGLAVAELFGGSVRFLASMASSTEKEIAVVKYDARSLKPQGSEPRCVECGRPITPDGTPLSEIPSLSTSSKSQKSIAAVKRIPSSASRMTRQKDECTCCDCKASDNRKMKGNDGSSTRGDIEKSSENKMSDREVNRPCPADITSIMSTKTSKSRKKKRKPEKKDQSVTVNMPRSKLKQLSKVTRNDDTTSTANTEDSTICVSSQTPQKMSSSSAVKKTTNANKVSKCPCDEDSTAHKSFEEYSSAFEEKIGKRESCNWSIDKSSMNENMPCNCSSMDSVSREEGSCNCAPLTQ